MNTTDTENTKSSCYSGSCSFYWSNCLIASIGVAVMGSESYSSAIFCTFIKHYLKHKSLMSSQPCCSEKTYYKIKFTTNKIMEAFKSFI